MITNYQENNDERFQHAELLLSRRVETASRRLAERLVVVRDAHGLSWRDLLASQRAVRQTVNTSAELSPADYFHGVAEPKAKVLRDKAVSVIEAERDPITEAVLRFRRSVQPVKPRPEVNYDPAVIDSTVRSHLQTLASVADACAIGRSALDDVGDRWQGRLRRAAIRRATSSILMSPVGETERLIAQAEMDLLDEAPWVQGDRLLSAFELAHAQISTHLDELALDVAVAMPGRTVQVRPSSIRSLPGGPRTP